jgi:hypothetical protein
MGDPQRAGTDPRRFREDLAQVGFLEREGSERGERGLLPEQTFDISCHLERPSCHATTRIGQREILQFTVVKVLPFRDRRG